MQMRGRVSLIRFVALLFAMTLLNLVPAGTAQGHPMSSVWGPEVSLGAAGDGHWSTAALSSARQEMSVATVGSRILFAGGVTGSCFRPSACGTSNAVDLYDASTNQWSVATLSSRRIRMAAVTVGDKAVFAGGLPTYQGGASAAVDIYDGPTGSWSTATLSGPRYPITAATVGSKALYTGVRAFSGEDVRIRPDFDIYDAATGQWSTAPLATVRSSPVLVTVGSQVLFVDRDAVDIYDDATGQWSTGTLSAARFGYAVARVGTRVLFAGGYTCATTAPTSCDDQTPFATVDIYDASSGTWSTASLSEARSAAATATLGSRVFFAGGTVGALPSATVDVYDAATGQWSTASLSEPRWAIATATIGTRIIFAGGGFPRNNHSAVVDVYDTTTGQWSTDGLPSGGSIPRRLTLGSQILFAGGDTIDLYDGMTGQWSAARLSEPRNGYAVGVAGTRALFAGGEGCTRRLPSTNSCADVGSLTTVDIYDSATSEQ
jgi:hypothetical protein